ncbi:hypothetical protein BU24DRAFT_187834 [Aaosphaeria arxii CBS 175.79]|uniref:Uncharacterized protein n=1 Tax=Aaosphaeria arxii CBS 175.79 TaxID=1450172 RepID=A0A6A5XRK1_9PLEO|nr:uncharacterized protein BU24DRAFT_187834 [Aaosphaeria arxii CBS 175.79]KAF2015918.1 hypothetical protein BU24DRAFT_187834 [Aaosphaeria arxii CBS 175.79]
MRAIAGGEISLPGRGCLLLTTQVTSCEGSHFREKPKRKACLHNSYGGKEYWRATGIRLGQLFRVRVQVCAEYSIGKHPLVTASSASRSKFQGCLVAAWGLALDYLGTSRARLFQCGWASNNTYIHHRGPQQHHPSIDTAPKACVSPCLALLQRPIQ